MGGNWRGYSPNVIGTGRNVDKPWLFFHFIHKKWAFEISYPTSTERKDTNVGSTHNA